MTDSIHFWFGLTDELAKAGEAACAQVGAKIRSKGKGKGLGRGKGKGPIGVPKKTVGRREMPKGAGEAFMGGFMGAFGKEAWERWSSEQALAEAKKLNALIKQHGGVQGGVAAYNKARKSGKGSSVKAKIEAARRDPSTKANPKDTGPAGSGLQDPRVKAMKAKMKAGLLGRK